MDDRARKEERGAVELRKVTGLCGAASAPIFSVCARPTLAYERANGAAAAPAASAMRRTRAAGARARARARSRDRRCQLAFSDNFHPSKGARLRPLAPLLFHLSLFLSMCTFTIARFTIATIAPRRPSIATSIEDEKDRRQHDPRVVVLVSYVHP